MAPTVDAEPRHGRRIPSAAAGVATAAMVAAAARLVRTFLMAWLVSWLDLFGHTNMRWRRQETCKLATMGHIRFHGCRDLLVYKFPIPHSLHNSSSAVFMRSAAAA